MRESPIEPLVSPLETRQRAQFDSLTPGVGVLGMACSGAITVIHSQWIGTHAVAVSRPNVLDSAVLIGSVGRSNKPVGKAGSRMDKLGCGAQNPCGKSCPKRIGL